MTFGPRHAKHKQRNGRSIQSIANKFRPWDSRPEERMLQRNAWSRQTSTAWQASRSRRRSFQAPARPALLPARPSAAQGRLGEPGIAQTDPNPFTGFLGTPADLSSNQRFPKATARASCRNPPRRPLPPWERSPHTEVAVARGCGRKPRGAAPGGESGAPEKPN